MKWCPYADCGFNGSNDDVDEHRADNHRDEPQQGSNLSHRPRWERLGDAREAADLLVTDIAGVWAIMARTGTLAATRDSPKDEWTIWRRS